jgi:hypothetical protein
VSRPRVSAAAAVVAGVAIATVSGPHGLIWQSRIPGGSLEAARWAAVHMAQRLQDAGIWGVL